MYFVYIDIRNTDTALRYYGFPVLSNPTQEMICIIRTQYGCDRPAYRENTEAIHSDKIEGYNTYESGTRFGTYREKIPALFSSDGILFQIPTVLFSTTIPTTVRGTWCAMPWSCLVAKLTGLRLPGGGGCIGCRVVVLYVRKRRTLPVIGNPWALKLSKQENRKEISSR